MPTSSISQVKAAGLQLGSEAFSPGGLGEHFRQGGKVAGKQCLDLTQTSEWTRDDMSAFIRIVRLTRLAANKIGPP